MKSRGKTGFWLENGLETKEKAYRQRKTPQGIIIWLCVCGAADGSWRMVDCWGGSITMTLELVSAVSVIQ